MFLRINSHTLLLSSRHTFALNLPRVAKLMSLKATFRLSKLNLISNKLRNVGRITALYNEVLSGRQPRPDVKVLRLLGTDFVPISTRKESH